MRHSNAPQNAAVDPNRHAGLFTKTQFHSCQWHFTNSCTVPSRGASGNRRGSQIGEETVQSLVQVSPRISAGVHSGYQMVRGDICLRRMHALRSSPGENTASCHRDCWFCPRHITNPLLILFGGEKNVMKTGARMSLPGPTQPVRKQWEQNQKIPITVKCVEIVELSRKNLMFESSGCWVAIPCPFLLQSPALH